MFVPKIQRGRLLNQGALSLDKKPRSVSVLKRNVRLVSANKLTAPQNFRQLFHRRVEDKQSYFLDTSKSSLTKSMKIGRKTPSPNLKARKSFLLKSKDLTPIRPNKDRKKKSPFSVSLGNALRMSEKYTNDPTPSTKLNDTPNIDLKKEAQKFQFFSISTPGSNT